jgi:hypothetical protein
MVGLIGKIYKDMFRMGTAQATEMMPTEKLILDGIPAMGDKG